MSSIVRLIAAQAKMHPEKPALLLSDGVLTYRMLEAYVSAATERIDRSDIARDGLVGVSISSPPHQIAVCLALMKLGISAVLLNANLLAAAERAGVADVLTDCPLPPAAAFKQHLIKNDWFVRGPDAHAQPPDRGFKPNQIVHIC